MKVFWLKTTLFGPLLLFSKITGLNAQLPEGCADLSAEFGLEDKVTGIIDSVSVAAPLVTNVFVNFNDQASEALSEVLMEWFPESMLGEAVRALDQAKEAWNDIISFSNQLNQKRECIPAVSDLFSLSPAPLNVTASGVTLVIDEFDDPKPGKIFVMALKTTKRRIELFLRILKDVCKLLPDGIPGISLLKEACDPVTALVEVPLLRAVRIIDRITPFVEGRLERIGIYNANIGFQYKNATAANLALLQQEMNWTPKKRKPSNHRELQSDECFNFGSANESVPIAQDSASAFKNFPIDAIAELVGDNPLIDTVRDLLEELADVVDNFISCIKDSSFELIGVTPTPIVTDKNGFQRVPDEYRDNFVLVLLKKRIESILKTEINTDKISEVICEALPLGPEQTCDTIKAGFRLFISTGVLALGELKDWIEFKLFIDGAHQTLVDRQYLTATYDNVLMFLDKVDRSGGKSKSGKSKFTSGKKSKSNNNKSHYKKSFEAEIVGAPIERGTLKLKPTKDGECLRFDLRLHSLGGSAILDGGAGASLLCEGAEIFLLVGPIAGGYASPLRVVGCLIEAHIMDDRCGDTIDELLQSAHKGKLFFKLGDELVGPVL